MKAVNKDLGRSNKVDKWYFEVFEMLELVKYGQLAICPVSVIHQNESTPYCRIELKHMYEHFSTGLEFESFEYIKLMQIKTLLELHLKGEGYDNLVLNRNDAISESVNRWTGGIRISVDFDFGQRQIDTYLQHLSRNEKGLNRIFEQWRNEKMGSFERWFKQYLSDFAPDTSNLEHYHSLLPREIPPQEKNKILEAFFITNPIKHIPLLNIEAMLWAVLAYESSTGGRRYPPNRGMINDILAVSGFLPYCDAMFIDKDIHSMLQFRQVKEYVEKFSTKIFCLRNKEEFIDYLNSLYQSATPNHRKYVEMLYGKQWKQPYWKMYEKLQR